MIVCRITNVVEMCGVCGQITPTNVPAGTVMLLEKVKSFTAFRVMATLEQE